MSLSVIFSRLLTTKHLTALGAWIQETHRPVLRVDGATGSLPAFVLSYLHEELRAPIVAVFPDPESARFLQGDLASMVDDPSDMLLFPPEAEADPNRLTNTIPVVQRMEVVVRMLEGFRGVVSTSVEALVPPVPRSSLAAEHMVTLSVGQDWAPHKLMLRLLELGFERVDFVESPGEIAWRGGIVDIYGYSGALPVRLEYFGDEVDSIREFDPGTQRSVADHSLVRVIPNLDQLGQKMPAGRDQLLSLLPQDSLIATFDRLRFEPERSADDAHPDEALDRVLNRMSAFRSISFGAFGRASSTDRLVLSSNPQPSFGGSLRHLRMHIQTNSSKGVNSYLLCDSPAQKTRMDELLSEQVAQDRLHILVASLHRGFETPSVAVYTDHELWGRHYQPRWRRRRIHRRTGATRTATASAWRFCGTCQPRCRQILWVS